METSPSPRFTTMTFNEFVEELAAKAEALREESENLLSIESPEMMQEEMIKRDLLKEETQKCINKLKDQQESIDRMVRKLREIKTMMSNDNKKLDSRKWDLIQSRKHHEK